MDSYLISFSMESEANHPSMFRVLFQFRQNLSLIKMHDKFIQTKTRGTNNWTNESPPVWLFPDVVPHVYQPNKTPSHETLVWFAYSQKLCWKVITIYHHFERKCICILRHGHKTFWMSHRSHALPYKEFVLSPLCLLVCTTNENRNK